MPGVSLADLMDEERLDWERERVKLFYVLYGERMDALNRADYRNVNSHGAHGARKGMSLTNKVIMEIAEELDRRLPFKQTDREAGESPRSDSLGGSRPASAISSHSEREAPSSVSPNTSSAPSSRPEVEAATVAERYGAQGEPETGQPLGGPGGTNSLPLPSHIVIPEEAKQ